MQERLPNVRNKKIWIIVGACAMIAFFLMWSLRNGDTPGVINSSPKVQEK